MLSKATKNKDQQKEQQDNIINNDKTTEYNLQGSLKYSNNMKSLKMDDLQSSMQEYSDGMETLRSQDLQTSILEEELKSKEQNKILNDSFNDRDTNWNIDHEIEELGIITPQKSSQINKYSDSKNRHSHNSLSTQSTLNKSQSSDSQNNEAQEKTKLNLGNSSFANNNKELKHNNTTHTSKTDQKEKINQTDNNTSIANKIKRIPIFFDKENRIIPKIESRFYKLYNDSKENKENKNSEFQIKRANKNSPKIDR